MKINNPRILLSRIRHGDFAHPGDIEAIEILLGELDDFKGLKGKRILDVGTGLGGTADYISKNNIADVYGIDIDVKAITYAKHRYPQLDLFVCDVLLIDSLFQNRSFDFIYSFNVFYHFIDPKIILRKLATVANKQTVLAIFDYVTLSENMDPITDLNNQEMHFLRLDKLETDFLQSGWKIDKEINLQKKYIEWYEAFLLRLEKNKNSLLDEFTLDAYEKVKQTFSLLLGNLKAKKLGGIIIYARLI